MPLPDPASTTAIFTDWLMAASLAVSVEVAACSASAVRLSASCVWRDSRSVSCLMSAFVAFIRLRERVLEQVETGIGLLQVLDEVFLLALALPAHALAGCVQRLPRLPQRILPRPGRQAAVVVVLLAARVLPFFLFDVDDAAAAEFMCVAALGRVCVLRERERDKCSLRKPRGSARKGERLWFA